MPQSKVKIMVAVYTISNTPTTIAKRFIFFFFLEWAGKLLVGCLVCHMRRNMVLPHPIIDDIHFDQWYLLGLHCKVSNFFPT